MKNILQIPNEQYQGIEAMSFSSMKEFLKSPAHYKAYKLRERPKPTEAQLIGTLVHSAILEPDTLSNYVIIEGDRRKTIIKEKIEAVEESGRTAVKPEQMEAAMRCRDSVFNHPILKDLFNGGQAESSIVCVHSGSGAPIKCRPDYFWPDAGVILDVKTYDDLTDRSIERQIVRMSYDLQALHYLTTASEFLGRDLRLFGNVFIEVEPPYGVRLVTISDPSLEKAMEKYRYYDMLQMYKECLDKNHWPNYSPEPYTAQLF